MLFGKDVSIKIGDPLLAVLRHAQVAQTTTDIWPHYVLEESGIGRAQIRGGLIAQLRIYSGFLELHEKRRDLTHVVRIAQLTDEIRRP